MKTHTIIHLLAFRASDDELYAEAFATTSDLWNWLIDAVIDAESELEDNTTAKMMYASGNFDDLDELMRDHAERGNVSWSINRVSGGTLCDLPVDPLPNPHSEIPVTL